VFFLVIFIFIFKYIFFVFYLFNLSKIFFIFLFLMAFFRKRGTFRRKILVFFFKLKIKKSSKNKEAVLGQVHSHSYLWLK
jgi:hypothetical protein